MRKLPIKGGRTMEYRDRRRGGGGSNRDATGIQARPPHLGKERKGGRRSDQLQGTEGGNGIEN